MCCPLDRRSLEELDDEWWCVQETPQDGADFVPVPPVPISQVDCSNTTGGLLACEVTGLRLAENGLRDNEGRAAMTDALGGLAAIATLQLLDLSKNSLDGELPDFSNGSTGLPNLRYLDITDNRLRGNLPLWLSQASLVSVLLRKNSFEYIDEGQPGFASYFGLVQKCKAPNRATCEGLPPLYCDAFGDLWKVRTDDPDKCVECNSIEVAAFSFLAFTALVVGMVSGYIWLISRYKATALRRWISTTGIFIGHLQTVVIFGSLRLIWPPSVETVLYSFDLNLGVDVSMLRPECLLLDIDVSPFVVYTTAMCGWLLSLLVGSFLLKHALSASGVLTPARLDSFEFARTIFFGMQLTTSLRISSRMFFAPLDPNSDSYALVTLGVFLAVVLLTVEVLLLLRYLLLLRTFLSAVPMVDKPPALSPYNSRPSLVPASSAENVTAAKTAPATTSSAAASKAAKAWNSAATAATAATAAAKFTAIAEKKQPACFNLKAAQAASSRDPLASCSGLASGCGSTESMGEGGTFRPSEVGKRISDKSLRPSESGESLRVGVTPGGTRKPRPSAREIADEQSRGRGRRGAPGLSPGLSPGPSTVSLDSLGPSTVSSGSLGCLRRTTDSRVASVTSAGQSPTTAEYGAGRPTTPPTPAPPASPPPGPPGGAADDAADMDMGCAAASLDASPGGGAYLYLVTRSRHEERVARCLLASDAVLPPERLEARLSYLMRRFSEHAPLWQFVVWGRQLALIITSIVFNWAADASYAAEGSRTHLDEDALEEAARGDAKMELVRVWLEVTFCLAIIALAWRGHVRVQPYAYRFQNQIESWLFSCDVGIIGLGLLYTLFSLPGRGGIGVSVSHEAQETVEALLLILLIGSVVFSAMYLGYGWWVGSMLENLALQPDGTRGSGSGGSDGSPSRRWHKRGAANAAAAAASRLGDATPESSQRLSETGPGQHGGWNGGRATPPLGGGSIRLSSCEESGGDNSPRTDFTFEDRVSQLTLNAGKERCTGASRCTADRNTSVRGTASGAVTPTPGRLGRQGSSTSGRLGQSPCPGRLGRQGSSTAQSPCPRPVSRQGSSLFMKAQSRGPTTLVAFEESDMDMDMDMDMELADGGGGGSARTPREGSAWVNTLKMKRIASRWVCRALGAEETREGRRSYRAGDDGKPACPPGLESAASFASMRASKVERAPGSFAPSLSRSCFSSRTSRTSRTSCRLSERRRSVDRAPTTADTTPRQHRTLGTTGTHGGSSKPSLTHASSAHGGSCNRVLSRTASYTHGSNKSLSHSASMHGGSSKALCRVPSRPSFRLSSMAPDGGPMI